MQPMVGDAQFVVVIVNVKQQVGDNFSRFFPTYKCAVMVIGGSTGKNFYIWKYGFDMSRDPRTNQYILC
jgi:hypothetical protein